MKEIITHTYKCELCNKIFDNIELAQKHEQELHKKVKQINSVIYHETSIYPHYVNILMEDGTIQTYYSEECLEDR